MTRRTFGFSSPNPIAFTEIKAWMDEEQYSEENRSLFILAVISMDNVYIEEWLKQNSSKKKTNKGH